LKELASTLKVTLESVCGVGAGFVNETLWFDWSFRVADVTLLRW
jgi:hypothetical protein